jgi:hypothetical protein
MMLPLDIGKRISSGCQEVLVCRNDCAVELEFDGGLCSAHRSELARGIEAAGLRFGDIRCKLNDFDGLSGAIRDRVI